MIELSTAASLPASTAHDVFLDDVVRGLRARHKHLPCKYFYDRRGSELFERICLLDEYYLTRSELAIMERFAGEMGRQIGQGVRLVEFGSGSSVKTRYLLDSLPEPAAYVPLDISGEHLRQAAGELARDYPRLEVLPVCADFTEPFALPVPARAATHTAVYFPGSTIGNFVPARAVELLRQIAALCGAGGGLLIGFDLKKPTATIEAAYNDARHVTAEFNLNLLRRINRELAGDFDLDQFVHQANYHAARSRIEMRLVSRRDQQVSIGGQRIAFAAGESICTEYSHKYALEEFARLAARAGLTLRKAWTDERRYFAVAHFVVAG